MVSVAFRVVSSGGNLINKKGGGGGSAYCVGMNASADFQDSFVWLFHL